MSRPSNTRGASTTNIPSGGWRVLEGKLAIVTGQHHHHYHHPPPISRKGERGRLLKGGGGNE